MNFRSEVAKKGRPKSGGINLGRPHEQLRYEAFLEVAKFVEENDDEQIRVNDLMNKMIEHLKDTSCTAYSFPYMMTKLKENFGDRIVITQINGKSNIVTFCSSAKVVLQSFYEQRKEEHTETEAQRIVLTAAKLIRNSIKSVELCNEFYPAQEQLEKTEEALKFLPPILISFLEILMNGKDTDLKLASIGQAFTQACCPRVMIAPLQLGLSTKMHFLWGHASLWTHFTNMVLVALTRRCRSLSRMLPCSRVVMCLFLILVKAMYSSLLTMLIMTSGLLTAMEPSTAWVL